MSSEPNFQSIWEYEIRDEYRAEFLDAYRSDGLWVNLFSGCKGYIKTELKQDLENHKRYLTIDYWRSQSDFLAMNQNKGDEYKRLDKQCESYTLSENHIGYFSNE